MIHPKYNVGAKYNNDLALVRLNEQAQFGANIRAVCLPRENKLELQLKKNDSYMDCYVAGWGLSESTFMIILKNFVLQLNLVKRFIFIMPYKMQYLGSGSVVQDT